MTREEEIQKLIDEETGIDNYGSSDYQIGVCDGVRLADKHPSVDTIKKIVCYALRFTNIMLVDNLEEGVEWELLIKKAMSERGDK